MLALFLTLSSGIVTKASFTKHTSSPLFSGSLSQPPPMDSPLFGTVKGSPLAARAQRCRSSPALLLLDLRPRAPDLCYLFPLQPWPKCSRPRAYPWTLPRKAGQAPPLPSCSLHQKVSPLAYLVLICLMLVFFSTLLSFRHFKNYTEHVKFTWIMWLKNRILISIDFLFFCFFFLITCPLFHVNFGLFSLLQPQIQMCIPMLLS